MSKNVTIVSCFINLQDVHNKKKNWYLNTSKSLLEIDNNLILFVSSDIYEDVKKIRKDFGLLNKTHIINIKLSDFELYKYKDKIIKNRLNNPLYINSRNTPDYFILVGSKMEMLKKSIELNNFGSEYYIWIDFGIFAQKYTGKGMIENIIKNIKDKFSCCYIHYRNKNFITNYSEFYKFGHCGIAGGVLSGRNDYILKIYELFIHKTFEVIDKGYGHSEEQILTELESDNPELFDFYVGDYSSIISNYCNIIYDVDCIFQHFITNARNDSNNNYVYKICKNIEESLKLNLINLNPNQLMKYYYEYFISSWYVDRKKCLDILEYLNYNMNISLDLCKIFIENIDHYTNNFDFISIILPNKKNAKITKTISSKELENLKKDYHVYIYSDNPPITGSYLLINNPVIRSKNKIRDIKYDLIL